MRIGLRFTAPGVRSDQRALVLGREVDLLRPSAVAEALHLEDPALAIEGLLLDDRADEDQRQRDPEEDRPEVDQRSDDGADEQEPDYDYGDLHWRPGF